MGLIVTFYSYKGGVGRTMALANIAVILANNGHKVLVVDWDLESSGLYSYFNSENCKILPNRLESDDGLIQLLSSRVSPDASDIQRNWRSYLHKVLLSNDKSFTFLSSGNKSKSYTTKLYDFNWKDFYYKDEGAGHRFLQQLRKEWKGQENGYDFVLIDSRTGLAESARVCTIDMPDILIPVFTSNNQSLVVANTARAFQSNRKKNSTPLIVYPLPSCIEMGTGHREEEEWLDKFAEKFGSFYRDGWLPIPTEKKEFEELNNNEIKQILRHVAIPKISSFCFGEQLPALNQQLNDATKKGFNPQGDITRSYKITAHVISDNFLNLQWLADVISPEAFKMSTQNPITEENQESTRKQVDRITPNPSTTLSTESIDSTNNKSRYAFITLIGNVATGFLLILISLASLKTLGVFDWVENLNNKNPQQQGRVNYYRVDNRSKLAEDNKVFKDLQYLHCKYSRALLKNNDVETVVTFSDKPKIERKLTINQPVEINKICDYLLSQQSISSESKIDLSIINLIQAILYWDELSRVENPSSNTRTIVTALVYDDGISLLNQLNDQTIKQSEDLKKLFEQVSQRNIYLTIMRVNKRNVADRLDDISKSTSNVKICPVSKSEEMDNCLKDTFQKVRSQGF